MVLFWSFEHDAETTVSSTVGVAFRLNNEHAALVEAGNQGQKMEGADSCLQFSSYIQQCCICVAQVLHWNPSPL